MNTRRKPEAQYICMSDMHADDDLHTELVMSDKMVEKPKPSLTAKRQYTDVSATMITSESVGKHSNRVAERARSMGQVLRIFSPDFSGRWRSQTKSGKFDANDVANTSQNRGWVSLS